MNYNILIYNPDYIEKYIELIPKFKELNNGNTTIKICENEMDLESYIREADILFVNQNFSGQNSPVYFQILFIMKKIIIYQNRS